MKQLETSPLQIAALGSFSSYSFTAAKSFFGRNAQFVSQESTEDVFTSVANGKADVGVVPLENSTTGSILETYDNLITHQLQIIGEINLRIHHQLLVARGNSKPDLQMVTACYSHFQAIIQCRKFFKDHPWIKPEIITDTATAAKHVKERGDPSVSAIAGRNAATTYGLEILLPNIEDSHVNTTRFCIVSKKGTKKGNKLSLIFALDHVPGSLVKTLLPFSQNDLNLTKIESRPVFGKIWEYVFILDFEFTDQKKVSRAIAMMKENVRFLTVLGQYKKGDLYET